MRFLLLLALAAAACDREPVPLGNGRAHQLKLQAYRKSDSHDAVGLAHLKPGDHLSITRPMLQLSWNPLSWISEDFQRVLNARVEVRSASCTPASLCKIEFHPRRYERTLSYWLIYAADPGHGQLHMTAGTDVGEVSDTFDIAVEP
jgi:hypothetical protein